jgi:hypothetical protein
MRKTTTKRVALSAAVVAGAALLQACSKSSSDGSATQPSAPNAVAAAFQSMNSKINAGSGLIANSKGSALIRSLKKLVDVSVMAPTDSENVWNAATLFFDPRCSGGGDAGDVGNYCAQSLPDAGYPSATIPAESFSTKEYLGFLADANAVRANGSSISVFGRIKTALGTPCAMMIVLGQKNAGALPTSGAYSVTLASNHVSLIQQACGFDASNAVGMTLNLTFVPTSDTTNYDTKVVMSASNMGTITQYMRVNDSVVNVAVAEHHEYESGGDPFTSVSRTMVSLNRVTGVLRAEYLSFGYKDDGTPGGDGGEWHRLYVDEANHDGVMINGSLGDFKRLLAVKGKPDVENSQAAYAIGHLGGMPLSGIVAAASSSSTLYAFQGCAQKSDGAYVKDGYTDCDGVTGVDISAGGGLIAQMNALNTKIMGYDPAAPASLVPFDDATVFGETHTVPFTNSTDIYSSAPEVKAP